MDKVNHYEIPADDTDRAQKFYSDLFGWNIMAIEGMPYWGIASSNTDENGKGNEPGAIGGGLFKREDGQNLGPVVVITVADIKKKLEEINSAGGSTTLDVMEVGDFGLYARFKDTEGNEMGLWQNLKEM